MNSGIQPGPKLTRPQFDIGDIFRDHGEAYRQSRELSRPQSQVLGAVAACRTAKLGGHIQECSNCEYAVPAFNSCRNRHCPKCQGLQQAAWIEERMGRVLPTHYFHVVLTLPEALRPLVRSNPEYLLGTLLRTAGEALLILGEDPKRLGAQLGVTTVLHTWSRSLEYHPHVHCIVTGGGLTEGGERWVSARPRYLFPARVISRLFRGRFMYNLVRAYEAGKLKFEGASAELADPTNFKRLKKLLYAQDWVAYAKRPFGGPKQIFSYLGRYTHRVGISNQRLKSVTPTQITFATKDGKAINVAPQEFIRRFLLHVLPRGFVKIRHYGLLSARHAKVRLKGALELLMPPTQTVSATPEPGTFESTVATPARPPIEATPPTASGVNEASLPSLRAANDQEGQPSNTWEMRLLQLTGVNVMLCPCCNGRLVRRPIARLNSS